MSAFSTPWEGAAQSSPGRALSCLQLDLLGYGKRVVYLDAEIAHSAFQLRVPEQS